jgi:hypothetical protein
MIQTASLRVWGRAIPLWTVALAFVVLGLIAYSPYFSSGFSGDDFMFISMLEGAVPYNPVAGFWYGDMDSYLGFTLLWWKEPGVQGAFLRPLASWTLTLLYGAFGRNAVPFHITLAVVHGLSTFVAFLVLRQLSGRDLPSLLAALLFLICEDHGMTVAWIATITDLLCVLFLNLAFLCHIVAGRRRKLWLFGLSLVLFLAAITSKETAAIYPLIVVAYEFFFADQFSPKPAQVNRVTRWRLFFQRWPAWVPPLALFGVYMAIYRALVPAMRTLMYLDPFSQPGRYLGTMLVSLPVMFVGLLTQFLPSLVLLAPVTQPFAVGAGVMMMVLLVWALLPYRRERAVWFSLFVFVVGLLPGLATDPGERLLYFPSVYGLFVVAWLIIQVPIWRRAITPDAPPGVRILGSIWGWYLLVSALIGPLVLLFIYPSMWIPGLRLPEQTILDSLPLIDEGDHQHVVYLNTDSSYNTFYLPDIYRYHRGEYVDLRLLSSFHGHVWARQEGERALGIRVEEAGWLSNMFARVVRITPQFAVGDVYTTPLFAATILATTADGQDVQEVGFEFVLPLDDPSLVLLTYDGHSYRRWRPSPEWALLNSRLDPFGF